MEKIELFFKDLSVSFKTLMKRLLFSSEGLPIVLTITVLAVLFVLVRMKSVEQAYTKNDLSKQIKKSKYINKELQARKAKLLSVKNLRKMARKNHLKEPSQAQVIVIP